MNDWMHGVERWRRGRRLARVRAELERRGLNVRELSDEELEAVITAGRDALASAKTRGGEVTAAFVTLVREREKI
jgi:hypothetical protein